MHVKSDAVIRVSAIPLMLLVGTAGAAPYEIPWYTIDGGGVMGNTGGNNVLSGTLAQSDAGTNSGATYTLAGGFWAGATGRQPAVEQPLPEEWNNPARTACMPGTCSATTTQDCERDRDCPQGETCDSPCVGDAFCVPAPGGGFPGVCYAPKNRWISVAPNPANAGVSTARRITLTSGDGCAPQVLGWMGAPDAQGVVRIVDEANRHYMDWSTVSAPEWCSNDAHCSSGTCDTVADQCNTSTTDVVHVGDCETSPGMTYDIEAIADGAPVTDPAAYSTALSLSTVDVWGDCIGATVGGGLHNLPADGGATFGDILGVVKGFQGNGASPPSWLDLVATSAVDPVPDYAVTFGDILAAVKGFQNQPYDLPLPCSCP